MFFPFLRDVSVPLASDTLGDPRRFRDTPMAAFFEVSECFRRPEGVVLPFDGVAGSFLFFSSSTFRSSSLLFSASVSSELYIPEVRSLVNFVAELSTYLFVCIRIGIRTTAVIKVFLPLLKCFAYSFPKYSSSFFLPFLF